MIILELCIFVLYWLLHSIVVNADVGEYASAGTSQGVIYGGLLLVPAFLLTSYIILTVYFYSILLYHLLLIFNVRYLLRYRSIV